MLLRTALVSESSTHLSRFQTQHAHCVSGFPLVASDHVVEQEAPCSRGCHSPPQSISTYTRAESSYRRRRLRTVPTFFKSCFVSRIRCVWKDAFVLTVASLTTLPREIDASDRIMSSFTRSSSTETNTNEAGAFGCYGLFFVDPPPLDDLEPRLAPPRRNVYRDNASVPYWYHGIISTNSNTRLPSTAIETPSTAIETTAVPPVRRTRDSVEGFEQSRDAYLRMLGDGMGRISTLEAVKGEGHRSQIPPLVGGYPSRMPERRDSGAGVPTPSSGIVADHDFPGTLHLPRTPTAPVSQGVYPTKAESGTPNVASPSSSSSTGDRSSKERVRSQTPVRIPFPHHLPPWWKDSGLGGFRGSSGPVPDYNFTGVPTSPPRSFASVEQESVQPTSPKRSEPSVPERSGSPVQVFSTSADLAAYYGIPLVLPPPPKPLQSASRETVQQKVSGSPHTAFEAMRDSYLKMLNTIDAPSIPTHEERGRELATLYGIEEQMDDNTQLEELIDYLGGSPSGWSSSLFFPCFGDNLDMNQLLIDPEYNDFLADKDGYDHDYDGDSDMDSQDFHLRRKEVVTERYDDAPTAHPFPDSEASIEAEEGVDRSMGGVNGNTASPPVTLSPKHLVRTRFSDSSDPNIDHGYQEDEGDLYDDWSETSDNFPSPGEECHVGLYLNGDCLNDPSFSEYLKEPGPSTGGIIEL
ncbi:hypothetical protein NMY22_g2070 [Coprinellus aureogranulatus]|nr:hypothetical protein NMY22_g2070 [Coprinellus aureogranulatus]